MTQDILAPAAVLVVWTLVMMTWMAATRVPALRKLDRTQLKRGVRGPDLEPLIEPRTNWKAHNYAHLMEQPTIFYATIFILALAGYSPFDMVMAWLYVLLRIAHSVWQGAVNTQPGRAILFLLSSIALAILALSALVSVA